MKRLMLAGPPAEQGGPPTPGMSAEGAAAAVLGINLDELTQAVLKHWGWDERLAQAARPLSRTAGVRHPASVEETLRTVASLANEIASTPAMDVPKAVSAMHQIQLRYARALNLEARECQATLDHAIKLIDRPMAFGDEPAKAAASTRPTAAASPPASSAPKAPAAMLDDRPTMPMPPVADTSPAPLMPAGTLNVSPTSGGLRARLQGRTPGR
jgi:hypothetical protein